MKHIGHPIIGDTLYGNESNLIGRQALHCFEMKFIHPTTGEKMIVKALLPEDMERIIM